MKILHLVLDDKFIDMALREFETVAPGVHETVILGASAPFRYLAQVKPRTVDLAGFVQAASAREVQAVVFHGMPGAHLLALAQLPAGPLAIWLGWGYDYYGLLNDAFPQGLIQPDTAALLNRLRPPAAGAPAASVLAAARPYRKPTAAERQALRRVDLFSPVLDVEYHLVRRHCPELRARYLRWNYGTAEDDFAPEAAAPQQPGPDLLLGNSAMPTNNHLELFERVRRKVDLDGRRLIVPLSYGDAAYGQAVARKGRELFGDAFVPLLDYVDKARYIQLLASCGTLVLNTVRQQALGNVYISAQLGARIVLNRSCPLHGWLLRQGMPVCDLESMGVQPLDAAQRQQQQRAVLEIVGRQAQRLRTRELVNVALRERPLPPLPD